jgi:hypothetical protein
MSTRRSRVCIFAVLCALSVSAVRLARAEGTDNHVLQAVPVPGAVTIDGKLDDWDCSGRIPVCSDVAQAWGTLDRKSVV